MGVLNLFKLRNHYALSRDITHFARGFHAPCVKYERPLDGSMMYTGIDCESHSQLLTAFHLTLNYPLILTHAMRSDQYCRA